MSLLGLADLFVAESDHVQRISSIAIEQISASLQPKDDYTRRWIQEGAGAEASNFSLFNLSEAGIVIVFPSYTVASYATGPQYVIVSWAAVQDIVGPLAQR